MSRRARPLPRIRLDQLDSTIAAQDAQRLANEQADATARAAETMADWDRFEERNRALPADSQVD